jgi:phosphatidylglycerophosphate synthase
MWWFLFGLVLGACLLALLRWKNVKKIGMTWYEWIMGIASLILILLVIQNFVGSVAEEETRAAWMGVLFLGIPAVILGVLAVRLPLQRQLRSKA